MPNVDSPFKGANGKCSQANDAPESPNFQALKHSSSYVSPGTQYSLNPGARPCDAEGDPRAGLVWSQVCQVLKYRLLKGPHVDLRQRTAGRVWSRELTVIPVWALREPNPESSPHCESCPCLVPESWILNQYSPTVGLRRAGTLTWRGTYVAHKDESLVRQCHNYVMCLLGYLR